MKRLLMKMDKPLYFITVFLCIFGLLMIFSASSMESVTRYNASPYYFFFKQGVFLIAGYIAFIIILKIPLKKYDKFILFIILAILGSLLLLLTYGELTNNAISWFKLGPISIQPSEFAKTMTILYLAIYYDNNKHQLNNYVVVLTPLAITAAIAGLVILQPDLGTAIIYTVIVFLIFLSLPIDKLIKGKIYQIIIGIIIIFAFVMLASGKSIMNSRQLDRLNIFNPCQRFETTGYHVCNGYIAINNGGLFGVGLGNSTQKYSYLPEAHTDFIFAIIVEELGLIISLVIFVFYILLLSRIIIIARRSPTIRGAVICYGAFIYISMHIIINLTGLLGLLPMTGVPLPFFSYGGSFILNLLIIMGLVERVQIENFNYYNKKDLTK
jgi:cell division protein FtsW